MASLAADIISPCLRFHPPFSTTSPRHFLLYLRIHLALPLNILSLTYYKTSSFPGISSFIINSLIASENPAKRLSLMICVVLARTRFDLPPLAIDSLNDCNPFPVSRLYYSCLGMSFCACDNHAGRDYAHYEAGLIVVINDTVV